MYEYRARVIRVIDGDTLELEVDLGFDVFRNDTFRLAAINAPETSTDQGKAVKRFVEDLLPKGTEVFIQTIKDKKEKYGRYLAWIYFDASGTFSLNEQLLDNEMAVPYSGGKR